MMKQNPKRIKTPTQSHIDDLWERIGRQLKASGVKPKDIERAIKEVRAAKKRDSNA